MVRGIPMSKMLGEISSIWEARMIIVMSPIAE